MARVTVEDCLEKVGNHFALVILASERARQLYRSQFVSSLENRPTVAALKEIAEGKIRFDESIPNRLAEYLYELRIRGFKENESSLPSLP